MDTTGPAITIHQVSKVTNAVGTFDVLEYRRCSGMLIILTTNHTCNPAGFNPASSLTNNLWMSKTSSTENNFNTDKLNSGLSLSSLLNSH